MSRHHRGLGESALRPDGLSKVTGQFRYASDLTVPGMLHAVAVRSPHARAAIQHVDTARARSMPGVRAVLDQRDVPGAKNYGLEIADQPVLAGGEVRFWGEPVVIIAAENEESARRAAAVVRVDYLPLEPLTDPRRAAFDPGAPIVHPDGNLVRHQPVRLGDPGSARAEVIVTGEYQVGMQDQAPLGPEAALAIPVDDGVEIHAATQWLHRDREQVAPCLGLPKDKVRMVLAGVGGAFGAREDLSVQVHAGMLALHTRRPVRMVLNRAESFVGHVHRHPAWMRYEHGATSTGRLVYVIAEILLDGGAYTSSTRAVVGNAASLGAGPYQVPNVRIDAYGVRTNNPPCGAMRGFGAVQTTFAVEAQMDRLAQRLGMDPVELRAANALRLGSTISTSQRVDAPAPLAEMLHQVHELPLPAPPRPDDPNRLPGGVGGLGGILDVVRGVGYAVGIKNICFSEGFDDHSSARIRLAVRDGEAAAHVQTAAAEVGQGGVTIQQQIVRSELGVELVSIGRPDTSVGSAGSTSASRQTYMTGGAVRSACLAVRDRVLALAAARCDGLVAGERLSLHAGYVVSDRRGPLIGLAQLLDGDVVEETRRFHHRPTVAMDPVTGQGATHVQFAYCVHRAVVDVDTATGQVRVVELAAVQDVGRALNPLSIAGQIHGGSAQGLGLALMEEIVVSDGVIRNAGFTDYLIPTIADMPPMTVRILENADPHAPYGLRGVGEPPTLSSTPAVAAAVRAATGRPVCRVPIRPWDLVGPDA